MGQFGVAQLFVGGLSQQTNRSVVGSLETVVSKAAVADQLEAFGLDCPTPPLGVVPSLKDGLQEMLRIVGKVVHRQVFDPKVGEPSRGHQPPEVGGRHRLPRVKRSRIHRPAELGVDKLIHLLLCFKAVIVGDLASGEGRHLLASRRILLHAEAEHVGCGTV